MAVPTKPYSTVIQVSYLLQHRFFKQTASSSTVPSDTVLDQLITWADGLLEMEFHAVGYKMPWTELSGETWPAAQTTLLSYLSAIGAAGFATGSLKPAPMMSPGQRGSQGSIYSDAFGQAINKIREHGFRFRADYYPGSKAEKWIAEPYGPRMDFLEDYWDPTRYWLLQKYTQEIQEVFGEMAEIDIDWDYLYSLRSATSD